MIQIFQNLRNIIDYPLRQMFRWQRKGLQFRNEDKSHLYDELPDYIRDEAYEIEQKYRRMYRLESFYDSSLAKNYRENLFYLEMLEKGMTAAGVQLPDAVQAVDIGSSSWFYVQALAAFIQWWNTEQKREFSLEGYEIDAYRVYQDFHSRYDHALANIRQLTDVHYYPEGFTGQGKQYNLIFMFFPFVFPADHLEWGLPRSCFDPMGLLNSAWASLNPGGVLFIVNQGQKEFEAEREMIHRLGAEPAAGFQHNSLLFSYDIPRFVQVVIKNG